MKPKKTVKVLGSVQPFCSWLNIENKDGNHPLTKMDFAAVLAAIRRELRKRGFTVQR